MACRTRILLLSPTQRSVRLVVVRPPSYPQISQWRRACPSHLTCFLNIIATGDRYSIAPEEQLLSSTAAEAGWKIVTYEAGTCPIDSRCLDPSHLRATTPEESLQPIQASRYSATTTHPSLSARSLHPPAPVPHPTCAHRHPPLRAL